MSRSFKTHVFGRTCIISLKKLADLDIEHEAQTFQSAAASTESKMNIVQIPRDQLRA
jgi:hypothetical protein